MNVPSKKMVNASTKIMAIVFQTVLWCTSLYIDTFFCVQHLSTNASEQQAAEPIPKKDILQQPVTKISVNYTNGADGV